MFGIFVDHLGGHFYYPPHTAVLLFGVAGCCFRWGLMAWANRTWGWGRGDGHGGYRPFPDPYGGLSWCWEALGAVRGSGVYCSNPSWVCV